MTSNDVTVLSTDAGHRTRQVILYSVQCCYALPWTDNKYERTTDHSTCSLTRWQHFSAWKAAILNAWPQIENLTQVFLFCVVSTRASDCLESLVSEMACYVSRGLLNHSRSLTPQRHITGTSAGRHNVVPPSAGRDAWQAGPITDRPSDGTACAEASKKHRSAVLRPSVPRLTPNTERLRTTISEDWFNVISGRRQNSWTEKNAGVEKVAPESMAGKRRKMISDLEARSRHEEDVPD